MKLKIKFLSPEKIRSFFADRLDNAKKLSRNVKIESVSIDSALFSVYDPETGKDYYVYYKSSPEPFWSCNCSFFGIKGEYCTHILAVHYYLFCEFRKKNPSLLKFLKKSGNE